jgi:hypothetical protein
MTDAWMLDEQALRSALENGTDVDSLLFAGRSLLNYVADTGKIDVMRVLLEHGANVHTGPVSPLDFALCHQPQMAAEMVLLLMRYGAKTKMNMWNSPIKHLYIAIQVLSIMCIPLVRSRRKGWLATDCIRLLHSFLTGMHQIRIAVTHEGKRTQFVDLL